MANVTPMKRVFVVGSARLPDPDPNASPEEALALYRNSYPAIAHCAIAEPQEEDGELVYRVRPPTQTTKGADGDQSAALAEVDAWERKQLAGRAHLADRATIQQAAHFLVERAGRDSAPADDLASEILSMV